MKIKKAEIEYTESFKALKGENTLNINRSSKVLTTKDYSPVGNLKADENYIFDSAYKPLYCAPSYNGCNICVSSCDDCQGGCQTNCQDCVDGCNSGCQGCQDTCYNAACVSGCTNGCQTCQGTTGSCTNLNGCSHCDSNAQGSCSEIVGCPDNLFNTSQLWLQNYTQCRPCVNTISCSIYVDMFHADECEMLYNCGTGCRSQYDCSLYVACSSTCMMCDTSNFTCDASSCYSKVYKMM